MQGIQPHNLTNRELLRYMYILGFDKVPPEWIKDLVERFVRALDGEPLADDLK